MTKNATKRVAVLFLAVSGWFAFALLYSHAPTRDDAERPAPQLPADEEITVANNAIERAEPTGSRSTPAGEEARTEVIVRERVTAGRATNDVYSLRDVSDSLRLDLLGVLAGDRGNVLDGMRELGLSVTNEDFRNLLEVQTAGDASARRMRMQSLRLWAQQDPAAAADWLRESNHQTLHGVVSSIMQQWSKKSPEKALQWASELTDENQRNRALRQGVMVLSKENPERAAEWLQLISASSQHAYLAQRVASQWLETDPEEAHKWIEEQPQGKARDHGLYALAWHLAEETPEVAIEAAMQIGDDEVLERAVERVVGRWADFDPQGAVQFVNALEPGQIRDRTTRTLAMQFAKSDVHTALEWVNRIGDEDVAMQARRAIGYNWVRSDAEAALEWAEDTDLPERYRKHLKRYAERLAERKKLSENGNELY